MINVNIYSIKIGDTITPDMGFELANHFGMTYIAHRIEASPEKYKDFIFDGASCLPDALIAFLVGIKKECFTYKCALPHDIGYAYGEPGNKKERKVVDLNFKSNLNKKCSMFLGIAAIFYRAVRIGGIGKLSLSFSWGFAVK